jgi:hypothetical protein
MEALMDLADWLRSLGLERYKAAHIEPVSRKKFMSKLDNDAARDHALTRRMGRDPCEDADAACSIVFSQTLRGTARSGEGGSASDY